MIESNGKTNRAWSLAEAIQRLPADAQQKVLTLIDLLLELPSPVSARAELIIRDALAGARLAPNRCFQEIDSAIDYLISQRSVGDADDVVASVQ